MKNSNTNFYWTTNSWGSDYPPVNAEEIISRANELIDQYAADHPEFDEMDIAQYAQSMWEDFCDSDEVGGVFAIYVAPALLHHRDLVAMDATDRQLEAYNNTDQLNIFRNADGSYSIRGVWDAHFQGAEQLLAFLDEVRDSWDEEVDQ